MGFSLTARITAIEGCIIRCADAGLPRSIFIVHDDDGCFGDNRRGILMQNKGDGPPSLHL